MLVLGEKAASYERGTPVGGMCVWGGGTQVVMTGAKSLEQDPVNIQTCIYIYKHSLTFIYMYMYIYVYIYIYIGMDGRGGGVGRWS